MIGVSFPLTQPPRDVDIEYYFQRGLIIMKSFLALPVPATISLVPFSILIAVGGLVLALIVFRFGEVWFSDEAFTYIDEALAYIAWLVAFALVLCIIVFLPLLAFRKTRPASARGFLVSSYVFGAFTCMAGVLVCKIYLGSFWLAVGLLFVGIGVVPLGIIGAMIYSDWVAAGYLFAGLVLTLSSRAIGGAATASQ
jgi:hypothetical protein